MNDSWDEMRRAKEDQYFETQNKGALARLKNRPQGGKRTCPITQDPLEQITTMGVVIDRCPTCGGVWLDNGELEQILKGASTYQGEQKDWVSKFFGPLFGKKD